MSQDAGVRSVLMPKARIALLVVLALWFVGMAQGAPIFIPINPQSGYLLTDSEVVVHNPPPPHVIVQYDPPASPYFLDLASIGAHAGQELLLRGFGDMCFIGGAGCVESDGTLGGVFTVDASLGAHNLLNRLTAVGPPSGIISVVSPNTYYGNLATDISQDFALPNVLPGSELRVVIPDGANYLVVGVIDSHFSDSSDPDGDLGFFVELVPEPGTYLLFASGLAALWAVRRRLAQR
jgi:hypothetical protein